MLEPVKRVTAFAIKRYRPLRGLEILFCLRSWGWRPRLYAVARFASFYFGLGFRFASLYFGLGFCFASLIP